ncbi:MAG TPA: isocitrate lyase/phosphoenolpyruvate mutase family protein, partial [Polyangiaceae bacterium]|nr:isocitrate lyase/phosphoenolpyruvate mutase family protein [Polyangiaceae bacterium]
MSFKSVMNSQKTSKQFTVLHVKSKPLVPYNGWDAGSVAAIVEVGAKAVATSSASVASAQGYEDGEYLPLDFALEIVRRIVETIDVPVTVDFEGGYSEDDGELASNISKLIELGVVGINFEDIGWSKAMGCTASVDRRIAAIRRAAEQKGIPFF